ncbi:hypothetical protein SAMN03159341_103331 [Paenibacillus sp. 1_12]|uniref:hypothetical protein n=1 Tax=Paenibacillus sp. 1_12 TaxID=1566278 RepID=UPI0008F0258A|nr:hypothetical protein [Paenibacillus sp. 1_12]SFL12027.1 hypothetical protein SAMN03159341_103331 [Paenibacillus sp. 1_12]
MKGSSIRFMISITAALIAVSVFLSVAGCGGKKAEQQSGNQQKAQGKQQTSDKPIDSALKEQMNMYKDIKQYEFKESEKLQKANKTQLKKLQQNRSESQSKTSTNSNKKTEQKDTSNKEKGTSKQKEDQ